MNLISKFISIIVLFCAFSTLAQDKDTIPEYPKVLNYMGDTVLVFKFEQGLELSKQNEQRKECVVKRDILVQKGIEKDTIISSQKVKIDNQAKIIDNHKVIEKQKDDLNEICETEKIGLEREVKKHKRGKWIAIAGAVVVGVLGLIF